MATSFTGPVWKLDSADIGSLPRTILGAQNRRVWNGAPQTVNQQMAIGQIIWNAASATAGDTVVITDLNSNEIYRSAPATGNDFSDQTKFTPTIHVDGLIVTALPSGIVSLQIM